MIKTFRNKELVKLWNETKSKIDARFHDRIRRRLDRMGAAITTTELDVPGFDFHSLKGKPQRYSVHVIRSTLMVRGA